MPTRGSNVVAFVAPSPRPSPQSVAPPATPLRILVIEDAAEDRMVVRLLLETQGYVLTEAENGARGLIAAQAFRPDCILLDYHLPDYDGLEMLAALQTPDGHLPFAVVMLTASASGPTATRLLRAGALDFLTKQALSEDSLRRSITGSVERFRLMEERRRLEARNVQLAAIVMGSTDAILSIGLDLVVHSWNPGACTMFGYDEAEAVGRPLSELVVPEPSDAAPSEHYATIVAEKQAVLVEAVRRHRNGSLIEVEINAAPIEGPGGEVVAISVMFRDIGARKRSEEKITLLLREMEHRSKNILSVVQAVAQQTFAANPETFPARFGERLAALAASHSLLVAEQWERVEIARLVRSQLAHFADLLGTRVVIEGPSLALSVEAAQTIGMALHELATNSGKYGALSDHSGRVELTWDLASGAFTISWTERDGPTVAAPTRTGFGTTVIRRMVAANLNGEVELDFAPAGLSWRLNCPAASVLGAH